MRLSSSSFGSFNIDKDRRLSVTRKSSVSRKTSYTSDSYNIFTDKKNTEQSHSNYQDGRCSYEHDTLLRPFRHDTLIRPLSTEQSIEIQHSNICLAANVQKYVFKTKNDFEESLEVYNRINSDKVNGLWMNTKSFFECKGAVRVITKMCTRCYDAQKPRTKTDLYYVDLTEKNNVSNDSLSWLYGMDTSRKNLGDDGHKIKNQLRMLREQQNEGIAILQRKTSNPSQS